MSAELARRPRIVITTGVAARQPEPALAGRKNLLYAAAVERHGGDVVLMDASMAPVSVRAALATMDGLVLSGGADVHPRRYGEEVRGSHAPEEDRDCLEADAWQAATDAGLPVLGICRGLQAINVFLGGGLVQHVEDHAGPAYGHGPALRHPLRIVRETRLAGILEGAGRARATGTDPSVGADPPTDASAVTPASPLDDRLLVNSYHHQAVIASGLAPGVIASAFADSGDIELVEGIELPGERFVVAVQCHPERVESTPPAFDRLWAAFIAACRSGTVVRSTG